MFGFNVYTVALSQFNERQARQAHCEYKSVKH